MRCLVAATAVVATTSVISVGIGVAISAATAEGIRNPVSRGGAWTNRINDGAGLQLLRSRELVSLHLVAEVLVLTLHLPHLNLAEAVIEELGLSVEFGNDVVGIDCGILHDVVGLLNRAELT